MDVKSIALDAAQVKFAGQQGVVEAYASTFDNVDSYGDTIVRGAYTKTIKGKRPPLMLYGHRHLNVIGKWTEMKEDDHGLFVRGEFTPGHSLANDVYASMKHGAVSGLSIGYIAKDSEQKKDGGRTLKEIELFEISIEPMPADDDARATQVKGAIESLTTIRDVEDFLRDAERPLSRKAAEIFVSRMKAIFQGEPEELAELKRKYAEALTANVGLRSALLRAQLNQSLRS